MRSFAWPESSLFSSCSVFFFLRWVFSFCFVSVFTVSFRAVLFALHLFDPLHTSNYSHIFTSIIYLFAYTSVDSVAALLPLTLSNWAIECNPPSFLALDVAIEKSTKEWNVSERVVELNENESIMWVSLKSCSNSNSSVQTMHTSCAADEMRRNEQNEQEWWWK